MKRISLRRISLAAMALGALALPAAAQEGVATDIHKPDLATAEQVQGAGLFALCRAELPDPGVLGQPTHAYVDLARCGGHDHARRRGGLPVCPRRRGRHYHGPARQDVAAAGLAPRQRSCRGLRWDDRTPRGNPALLADPTLKRWDDMIKKGGKDAFRPCGR